MPQPKACILSVSGTTLTAGEKSLISAANPWGVILMGRSCESPDQVRALVDSICESAGRAVLVFIDQEGGRVRRLRPPGWPDFPAAGRYAAMHDRDPALGVEMTWLGHRLMAAELEPMGVRADCAPVCDLLHPGASKVVGDRSFGETADKVGVLARAALKGLSDGGVAGVIKHMPGHGRADVDSHESLPVVRAAASLLAEDIGAFRAVNDANMGMTGHVLFTALDEGAPATHSGRVIEHVIRGQIGFKGLLMTDDLGMNALGGRLAERAAKAFAAGCDIALHCAGFVKDAAEILREMAEIADASPDLTGGSLQRAQAAEAAIRDPEPFDRAAGWRRFEELLALSADARA
jgi:beta-N-acetylhexosaminidase